MLKNLKYGSLKAIGNLPFGKKTDSLFFFKFALA